jgi:hypothetical protein
MWTRSEFTKSYQEAQTKAEGEAGRLPAQFRARPRGEAWSYAWYDQNWRDSKEIFHCVVSTVVRGGTYLLNVGPDGLFQMSSIFDPLFPTLGEVPLDRWHFACAYPGPCAPNC